VAGDDGTTSASANEEAPKAVSDRFPGLRQLEEDVERAKLNQALTEARAATTKAKLPNTDVDLTSDTVSVSDKTTGLAQVLVQQNSIALADDIADIALDAARAAVDSSSKGRTYTFRVVNDVAALKSVDVYRVLEGQLKHLRSRIARLAPPIMKKSDAKEAEKSELALVEIMNFLPPSGLGAVLGVGAQALGVATKLFARNYQFSGREVPTEGLGFDLDLAKNLSAKKQKDESVFVEVDRVMPTTGSAKIIDDLWSLADDAEEVLAPAVAANARALADAKARAEVVTASITALSAEILELTKLVKDATQPDAKKANVKKPSADDGDVLKRLENLSKQRRDFEDKLPELKAEVAEAQSSYDRSSDLLVDIEEFLTTAFSPPAGGGRPPALDAARAEPLLKSGRSRGNHLILYGRLVAGGLDQTIATKVGSGTFQALTGASAEFALVRSDGRLLISGVRSVLQSSRMKLDSPDSFRQQRVNYMGRERVRSG
jgi:hypothetical protein